MPASRADHPLSYNKALPLPDNVHQAFQTIEQLWNIVRDLRGTVDSLGITSSEVTTADLAAVEKKIEYAQNDSILYTLMLSEL